VSVHLFYLCALRKLEKGPVFEQVEGLKEAVAEGGKGNLGSNSQVFQMLK
jgi:hypothetical protein